MKYLNLKNSGKIFPLFLFGFSTLVLALSSCEQYSFDPPTVDPGTELFFSTDVLPIFTKNCLSCHSGSISPDLRAENAYESLLDGYISADPVNDAESSLIYTKLESGHSTKIGALELDIILKWIQQGAKNN